MSRGISREDLLAAIDDLADDVDGTPTRSEMDDHGRYSSGPYYTEFGNWNSALEAAGYETNHCGSGKSNTPSKAELLEAIRDLADDLGRTPRKNDMNDDGRFSSQPYYNHFDGWNDALRKAGFGTNHETASDDELLDEIRRVADELGHAPTGAEFNDHAEYSVVTCADRFGSWLEAREAAGLSGTQITYGQRVSREDLLAELDRLGDLFDRAPTQQELLEFGSYSTTPYYRVFDTLRDALEAAGFELDSPDRDWPDDYPKDWIDRAELVRERDGHECIVCGMDAEEHDAEYGQKLHVHHVHTDEGDPNALENLVTMCAACHKKWDRVKADPRNASADGPTPADD